jgi:hypothetical protein
MPNQFIEIDGFYYELKPLNEPPPTKKVTKKKPKTKAVSKNERMEAAQVFAMIIAFLISAFIIYKKFTG